MTALQLLCSHSRNATEALHLDPTSEFLSPDLLFQPRKLQAAAPNTRNCHRLDVTCWKRFVHITLLDEHCRLNLPLFISRNKQPNGELHYNASITYDAQFNAASTLA